MVSERDGDVWVLELFWKFELINDDQHDAILMELDYYFGDNKHEG